MMDKRTCSLEGCEIVGKMRRGWCERHYRQWLKTGELTTAVFRMKRSPIEQIENQALLQRKWHLKRNFKLTLEEYDAMFEFQEGRCAICLSNNPGWGFKHFSIDHDHSCCPTLKTCGECIRGLL
jgi:hypothetical protein